MPREATSLILAAALLASSSCLRTTLTGGEGSPPEVTLRDVPPAFADVTADSRFTFDSTRPGRFECRVDVADFSPCRSPRAYTGLAKGAHSFEVRVSTPDGRVSRSWGKSASDSGLYVIYDPPVGGRS